MANKVLIIPVGYYTERVWKSVVRSGAERIYLITDAKPEYAVTKEVAIDIEERVHKANLMVEVMRKEADLSSRQEAYRILIGTIERERAENPLAKIIVDLTSTTKEVLLAASNLASAYGITLTYVPGTAKLTENFIRRAYAIRKDDPGSEIQEIEPIFSTREGKPLTQDEIRIMFKLGRGSYNSVRELAQELARDEGEEILKDAYEKSILRAILELERKGLINPNSDRRSRTKQVELSEVGKGVLEGLSEADEGLRRARLAPLLENRQKDSARP